MSRRILACLSIAALLAGCFGGDTARPDPKPSFVISDGAHPQTGNDNPDFFFLPTAVDNPVNDPDYDPGDFNPNLRPTVEICALDLPATAPESDVLPTTPCRVAPPGYFTSFEAPLGGAEFYDADWTVPNSDDDVYYRVRVKVGDISLGYADVHSVANPNLLHTVDDTRFIGQQDGSNLPVRFRIEIGALCNPPGLRPCNSGTIQETVGGDVTISTDGGATHSGVHQPGQPQGSQGQHTLTVQPCTNGDLNPRAIDLPTFGSCITVSATPALTSDLVNPAIVEVCDPGPDITTSGISEEQESRITLHRLDGSVVRALPHEAGCAIVHGSAQPTLRGVLKEFARGNLGSAVGKLATLVGPAPLNARRRRINLGGGGRTPGYSDFQWAMPCKMAPHTGNAQSAGVTTTLPTNPAVIVTDLDGDPCNRATVSFATTDGSLSLASVTTAADGIASVAWTLGPNVGAQGMTASGRGIGVAGNDGPRSILDPFMSIQDPFNPVPDPLPPPGQEAVILQTGTQSLTANGIIPFGSGGYSYKQVASNSTSPTGWQTPGFNEGANGFTTGGTAPFRSSGTPCNYPAAGTAWARNTDILVRKTFSLASAGTVQVRVAVDRYAKQVYLNGVLLNPTPLSWNACAVPGAASNFILTGQGNAGTNLVTVRASARSQSAFLDLQVAKQ